MLTFDDFLSENDQTQSAPKGNLGRKDAKIKSFDDFLDPADAPEVVEKKPERTLKGTAGDVMNSLGQGGIQAAQGVIGLADLAIAPVGGRGQIGKFIKDNVVDLDERSKSTKEFWQSDAQKAADKRVDDVDGFWNTAIAMGENPSTILKGVAESLPSMMTGAKAGNVVRLIENKLPAALSKYAPAIAQKLGVMGDVGAAATGEALISAGQSAEQIRSGSKTGLLTGEQQAIAAGSGAVTGLLGKVSGKVGKRLGIDDADVALTRGTMRAAGETTEISSKPWYRKALETGVKEGVIEELPQSAQEQMAQNYAEGKPIMQGVDEAAAKGMMTGIGQGGGFAILKSATGGDASTQSGDTQSSQFTQSAFANISGDEAVLTKKQQDRSRISLALSQLDDAELETATTHLAGGDTALQQLLKQSARSPETVQLQEQTLSAGSEEYIQVADAIRRDAGITTDNTETTPTAPAAAADAMAQMQTTAVDPTVDPTVDPGMNPGFIPQQLNSAGFEAEPIAQLQAQLLAVADGRKPGVVMGMEEAQALTESGALDNFSVAQAMDDNGSTAVFVGRTNEEVQAAAARVQEVGLMQAGGEFLQYAEPRATSDLPEGASVIQQIDEGLGQVIDEQIVTPATADKVKRIPGTVLRAIPVEQAKAERQQKVGEEQQLLQQFDQQTAFNRQEQVDVPQATQAVQSQPQAQAPTAPAGLGQDVGASVAPVAPNTAVAPATASGQAVAPAVAPVAPLRQMATAPSTASPRMTAWVDNFNADRGLQDDDQVDAGTIKEFTPLPKSPMLKIATAVKQAFGVDVVFVETPKEGMKRRNGLVFNKFNGFADMKNNQLVLNVDAVTALNTLGHELTHLLQVNHPEIYAKLELAVLSRLSAKKAAEFKKFLADAMTAEGDRKALEAEYRAEIVAEAMGEMAEQESFWADVFGRLSKDQAKTLYDTVMEALQKLANAFTKNAFIPGVKDMQKVRRAATDAFIGWAAKEANSVAAMGEAAQQENADASKTSQATTPGVNAAGVAQVSEPLARFSRENILAVTQGNRIAPMAVLDEPTKSMAQSGLDRRLPIRMEQSVVEKLLTGKDGLRRAMTPDEIMGLKAQLENPVAVLDDPTDKNSVVLLTATLIDGEPLVIAISKTPIEKTYPIDNVSSLGIKTQGATTEKAKFSPLKTAYSKDVGGILRWVQSTKIKHFDMALATKSYGKDLAPVTNALNIKAVADKAYRVKEGVDGPLGRPAYDSGPTPPTLKQQGKELASSTGTSVAQPKRIGENTLTLRKAVATETRFSRDSEIKAIADTLPEGYAGATLIDILYGDETHPVFTNKQGKINTRIAKYLEERTLKIVGNELDPANPAHQSIIAKLAAMEALAAMDKDGNAKQWYDATITNMMNLAARIFPSINESKQARISFSLITAITSQNLNVEDNMILAVKIYREWEKSRRFPENMGSGKSSGVMKSNFVKANELIDSMGWEKFIGLMEAKHSNSFLKKVFGFGSSGDTMDHIMSGSSVFGPKIGGGFFQNLVGNFDPVTMDMWFSRTIGRMTGRVRAFDSKLVEAQLLSFRSAWVAGGDGSRSLQADSFSESIDDDLLLHDDDYAFAAAEEIKLAHEKDYIKNRADFDAKSRFKSKLVNAATSLSKSMVVLRDSPDNGKHRNQLRDIIFKAIAEIKSASGVSVTPAALQALIWYPEQHLYRKLGGRQRVVGQDYVGAIAKVMQKEGISNEEIDRAIKVPAELQLGADSVGRGPTRSDDTRGEGKVQGKAAGSAKGNPVRETAKQSAGQDVVFEVAPDPDDKALNAAWQALPQEKKIAISMKLGKRYAKKAMSVLGMSGMVVEKIGSFEELTSPSFAVSLNKGGDPLLMAGLLGHILSQKSMMVTSETAFNGGEKRGVVTINLPESMGMEQIDALYQRLRSLKNKHGESIVGGQTTTARQMAVLNFSEYSKEQIDTKEMAALIDAHLGGEYNIKYAEVFSAMPGKGDYNYASSRHDGNAVARRASIQRDASSFRTQAAADLRSELGIQGTNFSRTADAQTTARLAEPAGRPSIGSSPGQRGSTVSQAIHYGTQAKLSTLVGAQFGSGLKGAELDRLNEPGVDPRIKRRVYFYLPVAGGIPAAESGLGGNVYSADLTNIYDPDGSIKGEGNTFESAVLDAGYRGYMNREQGTAVVMNENVPVRYLGTSDQFNKVQRLIQRVVPKVATRTEGNESVRKMDQIIGLQASKAAKSAAPSFKMQYGEARVATTEKNAANEALEAEGSSFRFSRRTKPDPEKTVTAYKLFRMDKRKPGQLFPLFVDANTPVPVGTWLDADEGEMKGDKVKSKIGPLAYRPGWHAGDVPLATHIGEKSASELTKPDLRPDDHVWAEIEMAADRDWQTIANQRGTNKDGKIVPVKAHITDQLPVDGFYRYKTNSNMTGNWMIGGSIKVTRILTDAEVESINSEQGVADLPRKAPLDLGRYGFSRQTSFSRMQDDMDQQIDFMQQRAEAAGYTDADEFIDKDYDGFVEAAREWREKHPENVLFSRNATKLMTSDDVLKFATDMKLPFHLGEALRRLNFADAFMLAKNKDERSKLVHDISDVTVKTFMDSLLPVQHWIENLPLSQLFIQRLRGDMRRADTVRGAKEKEVKSTFAEPMFIAIDKAAKATGFSVDQIKKAAEHWMTAKYAPKANRILIAKDRAKLKAAQAEMAAASRELSLAQQARVAARMPGVPGAQVSAAALRLANAIKRDADAPGKVADATRELNDRLNDVNSPVDTKTFTRGVAGGFNNAKAAAVVAEFESRIDPQLLADIAKPVYEMLKWKTQLDLQSGKVTQTMVNSWANHSDYVPLTGDPRYDEFTADIFQSGNQLNQDADMEMNGRKTSIADGGIDAAFTAVSKSINFASFQDFKRSLNNAYESAQRQGADIGLERVPVTGIIRNSDNYVIYREATARGMKAYAFKFADSEVIDALKKGNHEIANSVLKLAAAPTRLYARAVTQFSPMFAPLNFIRDVWERSEFVRIKKIYDQSGNQIDTDKVGRYAVFHALDPQLWIAAAQVNFGLKSRGKYRAELEQFIATGGSSTWGAVLSKSAGNLEGDIRSNTGRVKRGVHKVVDLVEAWNNVFEMIAPLAIFMAMKQQNVAVKDAAAETLDLMNFKKRGTAMPAIRSLYVFAQPAATSGYNLAQYLNTPKGKKRFAAQLVIGTAVYALLSAAWGDDDDEELGSKLDNLPNYMIERSIPIRLGDKVFKMPVGFGPPQLAWAFAGILNRWNSGRYTAGAALAEAGKAIAKSTTPITPSDMEITERPVDFMMTTFFPTVAKPILNIFADQTGLGSPLTTQFKNDKKMNWEQAKLSTPQFYTDLAQSIHEMTGIDLWPEHIKAISDGYMIGPMREIMSHFVDNPSKELRGAVTRMPLVASLLDNVNDTALLNNVYYRTRDDISEVAKEYESRQDRGELGDWMTPEKTTQVMAYKQFKSQELMFSKMRKIIMKSNADDDVITAQMQALEERSNQARRGVLVTYLQNKE